MVLKRRENLFSLLVPAYPLSRNVCPSKCIMIFMGQFSKDKGWYMLIRNFRQGRNFFARLDHGADIISQIANLAEENGIEIGVLSAIGALSRAELALLRSAFSRVRQNFPGRASGIGLLLRKYIPARRTALCACSCRPCGSDGKDLGGHLARGTIFAAELYLQELPGCPCKETLDIVTGLKLWTQE